MYIEIKGVRKLFIPQAPDKLALIWEQKKEQLTNIMPQLVQHYLQAPTQATSIKLYHGLPGIKLIYDDILTTLDSGDDYLVISDQQKWYELDPDYFESFIQKRALLNLNIKLLLQDNSHAKKYQKQQKKYNETIKLLPKNTKLDTNMIILPRKVIVIQTTEPLTALVITNQSIIDMNKSLFYVLWGII